MGSTRRRLKTDKIWRLSLTLGIMLGVWLCCSLLSSGEQINEAKDADAKALRYRQQWVASQKEQELQATRSAEKESKLAATIAQKSASLDVAEKRAIWLQNVLLYSALALALLGLAATWLWARSRLRSVTSQLTDEKETSRITREMRDVLQDRVNRLQRMESLGMLAGGVAHDFNNLLVGVICNAELLERKNKDLDEFSNQRIQQIIASAEKAADLSRQMLAYAGKQQIERSTININKITENMNLVLTATAGESLELVLESNSDSLIAEVDSTQIEQVLLNLVANASHASDDGSKIVVRTGSETIDNIDSDPLLHGTRQEGGDFVYFEVIDFGKGLEFDHTDRIFEPFYSISETGRGLGLSVVYGIVNGHDGLIRVTSEPGAGTRFRILLPRVALGLGQHLPGTESDATDTRDTSASVSLESKSNSRLDATSSPAKQKPNPRNTKGAVLVIDDEATVLNLAEAVLEFENWDVVTATDGAVGLAVLQRDQPRIDCVLLDVVMPIMGAEEVLARLSQEGINVPVVLMSGYSNTQLDQYRRNEQVVAVIAKPFRASELTAAIQLAIDNTAARIKKLA